MAIVKSKITAQGQISIPADVRRTLGVGPGSVLEWVENDGTYTVRRAGSVTFDDINKVLFPDGPPKKKVDVKAAIRQRMRDRYARD